MHVFLIGWNTQSQLSYKMRSVFKETQNIFPQLDLRSYFEYSTDDIFIFSQTTSAKLNGVRKYLWKDNDQITLFSGCVIDQQGIFQAQDAEQLAHHWKEITETVEGHFVILRVNIREGFLELITDSLGLEKVYSCKQGKGWFISNNIDLLKKITLMGNPDVLGISTYLTFGWAAAGRTLIENIHSFPGGQIWRWNKSDINPTISSYFTISASLELRKHTQPDIDGLKNSLIQTCKRIEQNYEKLTCPLTGGRDTRLLAALLKSAGVTAKYYTSGDEKSSDVQLAKRIAQKLKLNYEYYPINSDDIIRNWEKISKRLVFQNDGLVSLWQVQDVICQSEFPQNKDVTISGVGGEIARGYISEPKFYLFGHSKKTMQHLLFTRLVIKNRGLIKQTALHQTWKYFDKFCDETLNMGFKPVEIPDVFYLLDYVPNWNGSNLRKNTPDTDTFAPLTTRTFVRNAFLFSCFKRYVEPLHYQLINSLAPELSDIPFTGGPWRNQNPIINLSRWVVRRPLHISRVIFNKISRGTNIYGGIPTFDKSKWFEALLPYSRELCLDYSSSFFLWDYINRDYLDRLLDNSTFVSERASIMESLYLILTLFTYFSKI